ncbi:MAG: hypothetical protein GF411_18850 [Candidatus Lokiarchaeota archaeon]|nr:hypothetical protein [Candidatus Lokiarchaeota archaeon]
MNILEMINSRLRGNVSGSFEYSMPYQIDPNESDIVVYYDATLGQPSTRDEEGIDTNAEITQIVDMNDNDVDFSGWPDEEIDNLEYLAVQKVIENAQEEEAMHGQHLLDKARGKTI